MLARKIHDKEAVILSTEWKEGVIELLNTVYAHQCLSHQKQFEVFGFLYETELLVIVSFLDQKNLTKIPISCFISADIQPKQKTASILSHILDALGSFFDQLFAQKDWDPYSPTWEEFNFQKNTFYLKVTMENIALSIEADKILDDQ